MTHSKKFFWFYILALLLFVVAGCKDKSTNPSSTNNQSPNTVSMSGNTFVPATMTVAPHTTITWMNNSSVTHTATSNSGAWNTGDIIAGNSKAITFDTAGTFAYHCIYHSGMVGTINVQ